MAHFFMLVVILALLPAAIQTAIALGILAWYLFLALLAIGAVIFLLFNPVLLFWLIAIGGGFFAITWTSVQIETRWPGILQRLGYGSVSVISTIIGFVVVFDTLNRGKNTSDAFVMALIFWAVAIAAGWYVKKAKPVDTSRCLKR